MNRFNRDYHDPFISITHQDGITTVTDGPGGPLRPGSGRPAPLAVVLLTALPVLALPVLASQPWLLVAVLFASPLALLLSQLRD